MRATDGVQGHPGLRLLLFNLATDADDPILGFTTAWITALAERAAFVDVITMSAGQSDLPGNVSVFSIGKERGYGEPRRGVEFYRILIKLLASRRYDACFAHMAPLFAVMGAPLLKARGVPITLWYVHKSTPLLLRAAEKLVDRIVTASAESFPLPSHKVVITGHGIDTTSFSPQATPRALDGRFRVLAVGRIAPIKRLDVLVEAVRILVHEHGLGNINLRLIGPVDERDLAYAETLWRQAARSGIEEIVEFVGPLSQLSLVEEYRRSDVLVSLTGTGSLDKVVLEAMSCGVPVLTANASFERLAAGLGTNLVVSDDTVAVALGLKRLQAMGLSEKRVLGQQLRKVVERDHALDRLADLLTAKLLVVRGRVSQDALT